MQLHRTYEIMIINRGGFESKGDLLNGAHNQKDTKVPLV
jgi:hypothetical protein